MTKGFIFTLDAALASVLALVLLIVILNLTPINTGSNLGKLQLASLGNDFLSVLDQNSTFDSYASGSLDPVTDLQNHLTILPPNYCANVSIFVYDYSSGNFVLDAQHSANITKTDCTAPTTEPVKVKRIFLSFNPEKYGKAEMVVWLK
jgi:hypothetical protein